MSNAARHAFVGGIMKKSANYLPLTHREKAMIAWFFKFQFALLFVGCSWIVPFQATQSHLREFKALEEKVSIQPAIASPTPKSEEISVYEIASQTIREVSAYNAGDPAQTDASPCISANSENICAALAAGYNRCAANFVPFGTEILIESVDKSWRFQCLVTDRMNSRYPNRVDIAMSKDEKARAIKFGVQKLLVSVLEKK